MTDQNESPFGQMKRYFSEERSRTLFEFRKGNVLQALTSMNLDFPEAFRSNYCEYVKNNILETKYDDYKKEEHIEQEALGPHYLNLKIQPVDYIQANHLSFIEGCIVKYITRHKAKGGIEDLKKAQHYLDMLIKFEYEQEDEE